MATDDFEDPVFAARAYRHGEFILVVRDLFEIESALRREDVIERGQAVASPRTEEDAEILSMAIGRADQPEKQLALEEGGLIAERLIRPAEQFEDVGRARPTIVLILLGRRNRERLAAIFLRQAQNTVSASLAIEALYHEYPAFSEGFDMAGRDRQAEGSQQMQAILLIVHAVLHVDDTKGRRYFPELGLQDMGRRGRAEGTHPAPFAEEKSGLFLSAGDGDAEFMVKIDAERRSRQIGEHRLYLAFNDALA